MCPKNERLPESSLSVSGYQIAARLVSTGPSARLFFFCHFPDGPAVVDAPDVAVNQSIKEFV